MTVDLGKELIERDLARTMVGFVSSSSVSSSTSFPMRVSPVLVVVSAASKKKQQEKKTHQELEEEAASVRGTSEALTKRTTGPNQTNGKPSRSYRWEEGWARRSLCRNLPCRPSGLHH